LILSGFTSSSNIHPPLIFAGYNGSTAPTTSCIAFASWKHNGSTGRVVLADAEISSQWSNGTTPLITLLGGGNLGIGTTAPTSKLHVAGNSSPSITIDNTLATGYSRLLLKNTVVTGDTDGIFFNGSAETGLGGAGSFKLKATTGPIAFHTATVTNAISLAQAGDVTISQMVTAATFSLSGFSRISSAVNGNIALYNNGLSTFGLLQFGGTTSSFPALKRSTTYLQARLADDSAFAPIQGKLTTDTAYTGTTVVPTGFITLYDSTGTAYKVPCVAA
jgi:hypothetical protein